MKQKLHVAHVRMTADYLRYLTLMAIAKAKSGHPGMPLGCAELGVILYEMLNASGKFADCLARDRFILSAGHGSMFLYALNHLYGYPISLSDIAAFRQLKSHTPGHPEYDIARGIETTTGPLGQGFANAVGQAIEGKMLASRFNTPQVNLFDYDTYALVGDGCLMEGISYESASIAGHLGLDNLTAIYDDNEATIDGHTNKAFSENVADRFKSAGWKVAKIDLYHPQKKSALVQCYNKLLSFQKTRTGKPKLLIAKTCIGYGIKRLQGLHHAHAGIPTVEDIVSFVQNSTIKHLFAQHDIKGNDNITATIETQLKSGIFFVHTAIMPQLHLAQQRRSAKLIAWQKIYDNYLKQADKNGKRLKHFVNAQKKPTVISKTIYNALLTYELAPKKDFKPKASRDVFSAVMQKVAPHLPQWVGGAADLVASTKTVIHKQRLISHADFSAQDIAFGVREHAMGSIGNGLALSGMFLPFTSTFFTFLDYMKPSVRLASIMKLRHLFVFSHDSFYVGEDGPTHQPVEQLFSLRLVPNLYTFRPANDTETAFSLLYFLENTGPVALITTRQALSKEVFCLKSFPHSEDNKNQKAFQQQREKLYQNFKQGAYVIDTDENATNKNIDIILAGSGSEVGLLLQAKARLDKKGVRCRVISIPSLELFEAASLSYRTKLLEVQPTANQRNKPTQSSPPIFMCEAASYRSLSVLFDKRIYLLSMNHFGLSANMKDVAATFAFTAEKIARQCLQIIKK